MKDAWRNVLQIIMRKINHKSNRWVINKEENDVNNNHH